MHLFTRDLLEDGMKVQLSEGRSMLLTKVLAVVFGLVGYALIFVVKSIGGVLEVSHVKTIQFFMYLICWRKIVISILFTM